MEGIKEKEGKLSYEIDWRFIQAMAEKMAKNKGIKYIKWNWKKKIDVEDLLDALKRHSIEVFEGNYRDEDEELGHIVALATNAMMVYYQLKNIDHELPF